MKKTIRYLITSGVGCLIVLAIVLSKNIFGLDDAVEVYKVLTDAFFVAGVLITGFGLLVLASNGGTFDMLVYGVGRFFDLFRRDMMKVKHKTFYDYRVAKQDRKLGFGYLVIVGLAFLALSFLFLWLYYQVA
ncbi:MAG: DUF3899 domain-containing protein [Bacilli bacterium]|nr:DUF3899 domain-containing protein [Bacilli bacterium]